MMWGKEHLTKAINSEKGHLGTGDSVFKITNCDDIPYALTLIQQSYERKL